MNTSINPAGIGAQLLAATGTLATFAHVGGIVAFSAALVGTLTLTTSSGATTTFVAGTTGLQTLPSAGGAPTSSWVYSNPGADVGKAWIVTLGAGQML
jgi:hypothetical protein